MAARKLLIEVWDAIGLQRIMKSAVALNERIVNPAIKSKSRQAIAMLAQPVNRARPPERVEKAVRFLAPWTMTTPGSSRRFERP
jgi:hypothetical protein